MNYFSKFSLICSFSTSCYLFLKSILVGNKTIEIQQHDLYFVALYFHIYLIIGIFLFLKSYITFKIKKDGFLDKMFSAALLFDTILIFALLIFISNLGVPSRYDRPNGFITFGSFNFTPLYYIFIFILLNQILFLLLFGVNIFKKHKVENDHELLDCD